MEEITGRFGNDLRDNDRAVAAYMKECFGVEHK
jgi:hypothetical protein